MHRHLHIHKIRTLKNELAELYLNVTMQLFALSLVSVFVPIYLMKLGYDFDVAIMFYIISFACIGLFSITSAKLANRFGFKHIILLRTPLLIAYLIGLNFIPQVNSLFFIYFLAVLSGVSDSIYWISFNSLFVRNSHKGKRTKEVTEVKSLISFVNILAPAIGGVLAVAFSFNLLFIISIAVIFLSLIPLFMTKDIKPHVKFSFKKLFSKSHVKFFIGFIAQGMENVGFYVFWPVFIFVMLNDIEIVGFATTIGWIGVVLSSYVLMKEHVKIRTMLRYGAFFTAIVWILRIFAFDTFSMLLISILGGLTGIMIAIGYETKAWNRAVIENTEEFVVFRELSLAAGRVLLLLISLYVIDKFITVFAFSSVASLIFAFV
ncbi:MFS transporter [Candidatus Aenigmatarchaeota archaeon]